MTRKGFIFLKFRDVPVRHFTKMICPLSSTAFQRPNIVPSLFRPFKMGRNFLFGFFFFVFHAKSHTTNNHRTESNDISYSCPFSRDSNIRKFPKKIRVEKNSLKLLIFCLISSKYVIPQCMIG